MIAWAFTTNSVRDMVVFVIRYRVIALNSIPHKFNAKSVFFSFKDGLTSLRAYEYSTMF